jgi:hypothetical protein
MAAQQMVPWTAPLPGWDFPDEMYQIISPNIVQISSNIIKYLLKKSGRYLVRIYLPQTSYIK